MYRILYYIDEGLSFMKILIIVEQFDNGNNGTTMSARRFVEELERYEHTVFVVSTGSKRRNVVKELPLTPIVSHIVHS